MKQTMTMIVALALLVSELPVAPAAAQPRAVDRPNIVLLVADDWGFTDVGAFGGEIATPNIDALAMAGLRFANFHVAGSCSPTRAMLQTGVGNHRAGVGNMPETIPPEHRGRPGYDTVMNHNVVTIAELLQAAGYRTYLTGKWHLGNDATRLPHRRGYDRAFSLGDAGADNFEHRPIEGLRDAASWSENGRPVTLPGDFYSSRFLVDQMITYLDSGSASNRPFFASVNFLANHIPVQAPDSDLARYRAAYREGWDPIRRARAARAAALGILPASAASPRLPSNLNWATLDADDRTARTRAMQAYAAMATAMDREVGRLIAHLRTTGAYDNTIFVFLSDNGAEPTDPMTRLRNRLFLGYTYNLAPENIGRRNSFTFIGPGWASAAAAPLAGAKFSASEGGLRVPLVIAWPGNPRIQPGRIVGGLTHVMDIAPTLLELTGTPDHGGRWQNRDVEPITGRSLAPVLLNGADGVHFEDAPIGYELSGNSAVFAGDFKLVRNLAPIGDGQWRLFDIRRDPSETRDLAAAQPDRYRRMLMAYGDYARRNGVLPMPPGYSSDQQINDNAFERVMKPRLLKLAPWVAGGLLLLVGLILWGRRRRRTATTQTA